MISAANDGVDLQVPHVRNQAESTLASKDRYCRSDLESLLGRAKTILSDEGKYISAHRMKKHLTKLKKTERFAHFTELGSQAVQDVAERQDTAYQRFFKWVKTRDGRRCGPPTFKKVKKYKSFTLKQAGWKLLGGNRIRIQGRVYKFIKSREIEGCIKTVTVKRDAVGDLWLCFSVRLETYPSRGHAKSCGGLRFWTEDISDRIGWHADRITTIPAPKSQRPGRCATVTQPQGAGIAQLARSKTESGPHPAPNFGQPPRLVFQAGA